MSINKFLIDNKTNDPRNGGYLSGAHALGLPQLHISHVQDLYFTEGQLSQNEAQQLTLKLLTSPATQSAIWTDRPRST